MSLEFVLTSNWVNMREWKRLNNDCVKANICPWETGIDILNYILPYYEKSPTIPKPRLSKTAMRDNENSE